MGRMAGEGPLFLAEAPDLEDALARRKLHPELEIVAVRVGGGRVAAYGDLPAAGRVLQGHDEIIPRPRVFAFDKIVKHFTLYGRRAGPESPTRRVSDRASRVHSPALALTGWLVR